jgi:D-3-phosphoglycerate dehydrogenase
MFKCNILVNDVVDVSEKCERMKLKFVDKETIFKESDLITVHTPLDNTTKHMICSDSISIMKNGVLLINTARGSIFNLDAVEVALEQGKLGGVALDVYDEEPPQRWLLIDDARVICTPHIGGNASEAVLAMGVSAIKHIEGHLKSGVPE